MTINCRRILKRVVAYDDFTVEFSIPGFQNRFQGYGSDLTVRGVGFKSSVSVPVKSVITLDLHISPRFSAFRKIRMDAKVIRCQKQQNGMYEIGCAFAIDSPGQNFLREFIQWSAKHDSKRAASYGKRAHKRITAKDLFSVEIAQGHKQIFEKGFGSDLSPAGLRFTTVLPLQKNSIIDLVIYFSPLFHKTQKLKTEGRIIECRLPKNSFYYEVGSQFLDSSGKVTKVIEQFLEWIAVRQ